METNLNKSLHQLLRLEQRLLQPDVRHSAAELDGLLAEDFIEFGASGVICDKRAIIEELAQETTPQISITEFAARQLASDLVLVNYRATMTSTESGQTRHSLRNSIWRLVDGAWRMLFHQGTPAAG